MALSLKPIYGGMEDPSSGYWMEDQSQILGYQDQSGNQWRSGPNGWERNVSTGEYLPDGGGEGGFEIGSKWISGNPNFNLGYSLEPYRNLLSQLSGYAGGTAVGNSGLGGYEADLSGEGGGGSWTQATDPLSVFYDDENALNKLFDWKYQGRGNNANPYGSTGIRDALRGVAQKLGLTPAAADRAALAYQQQHLQENNEFYSEATSPALIANGIAKNLFTEAGRNYKDLTPEQQKEYIQRATNYQNTAKQFDEDGWKRDDLGSVWAFASDVSQGRWEENVENPERLFLGAEGPVGTWAWNQVFDAFGSSEEWDPTMNLYGGPTNKDYENAANQRVDTTGASVIQFVLDNAAGMIGGGAATTGLLNAGFTAAEAAAMVAAGKAAGSSIQAGGDFGDVTQNALMAALSAGGGGQLANEFGYADYASTIDAAAKGYKLAKDYENDNYLGIAGAAGAAAGGSVESLNNFKWGTDDADKFDLTKGMLTSNSDSALDLLPKQEDKTMSLDGYFDDFSGTWVDGSTPSSGLDSADSWMLSDNGQAYNTPAGGSDFWSSFNNTNFENPGLPNTTTGGGGLASILKALGLGGGGTNSTTGTSDMSRLLGTLGAAGLGAYGANATSNAYKDVAQQYMGMGQPYRERLANLYSNPNSFLQSDEVQLPTQQATNNVMRALSTKGNPFGSATALQEGQNYTANQLFGKLGEEKNRLGQLGGLAQFAAAAPQASMAGINAGQGVYSAAGYGLGAALNPQPTTLDIINSLKGLT